MHTYIHTVPRIDGCFLTAHSVNIHIKAAADVDIWVARRAYAAVSFADNAEPTIVLKAFVKMEKILNFQRFHFFSQYGTVRCGTCIEAIPADPKHRHAHEGYENIVWFKSFFTEAFAIADDKHSGKARNTCE